MTIKCQYHVTSLWQRERSSKNAICRPVSSVGATCRNTRVWATQLICYPDSMCRCNFILKLIVILISFESVQCLSSRRCLACTPITLLPFSFKETKLPFLTHMSRQFGLLKNFPCTSHQLPYPYQWHHSLQEHLVRARREGQGVQSRSCSAHPAESWYVVSCHFLMYLPKENNFSLGKWCRPGAEDWAWSGPTCGCGGPGCLCSPVAAHCPSKHAQRSGDQWLVSGSDMQGHCWSGWSQACTQWWGQLGGEHLGWCLALMLLLRTELAAGVVSGIWWGSGGTQVAGVCACTAVEVWAGCQCSSWALPDVERDSHNWHPPRQISVRVKANEICRGSVAAVPVIGFINGKI